MRHLATLALALLIGCGNDSSGDKDAATGGGDSSGSGMTDAAPPDAGGTAGVTCGMMTCATGMDCCVTFQNMMPAYACIASGGACQGVTQSCDGPEDCTTGDRCCAQFGGGDVTCQGGGGTCRELCHVAADCTMQGAMCCDNNFFNYSYCSLTCPQ